MESCNIGYVLLIASSIILCANALQKPKDISDAMYCLGCQVTVKELDFILSHKPTRGMGETVTRALRKVCDVHNFNKYDYDVKKVNTVCKHIRGDEEMEAVLITEYGRKHKTGKQSTYLDMTQLICGNVLGACNEASVLGNDEDGGIEFDAEIEDFIVKQGKNVRMPNPVKHQDATPSSPNHTTKLKDGDKVEEIHAEQEEEAVTVTTEDVKKIDAHEEL